MNDKELLMMAAKASELPLLYPSKDSEDFLVSYEKAWNQLTDDGDSLRLAVKLKLDVMTRWGEANSAVLDRNGSFTMQSDVDLDMYAATRRAIVRAAAEIGSKL